MQLVTLQMTIRKIDKQQGDRPSIQLELLTTHEQNIKLGEDLELLKELMEWLRMHEKLQVTLQAKI